MASATTVRLGGYTVATLPAAGTAGRTAYVTDATAPTYLGELTGGGAEGALIKGMGGICRPKYIVAIVPGAMRILRTLADPRIAQFISGGVILPELHFQYQDVVHCADDECHAHDTCENLEVLIPPGVSHEMYDYLPHVVMLFRWFPDRVFPVP